MFLVTSRVFTFHCIQIIKKLLIFVIFVIITHLTYFNSCWIVWFTLFFWSWSMNSSHSCEISQLSCELFVCLIDESSWIQSFIRYHCDLCIIVASCNVQHDPVTDDRWSTINYLWSTRSENGHSIDSKNVFLDFYSLVLCRSFLLIHSTNGCVF